MTSNKLQLKAIVVNGELKGMTVGQLTNSEEPNKITAEFGGLGHTYQYGFQDKDICEVIKNDFHEEEVSIMDDPEVFDESKSTYKTALFHFLYCLSLNHTCFVSRKAKNDPLIPRQLSVDPDERKKEMQQIKRQLTDEIKKIKSKKVVAEDENNYEIEYKGENPDEIVLVDSASRMGFSYVGGDQTVANLRIKNKDMKFEILEIFKFSSDRGMMSVIVKRKGKMFLYCKGGDKKLKAIMGTNQFCLEKTEEKSKLLALKGLRVLWIGFKEITEEDYQKWQNNYRDKIKNIQEEEERYQFQKKEWANLERGLVILGCTAVEDKLADEVPESIAEIQKASINFWILTGDNLATAKNIGIMCRLLTSDMELYELNDDLNKLKAEAGRDEFTQSAINEARTIITNFEKKLEGYHNDEETLETKAIIYIALKAIVDRYNKSVETNKERRRGILVESDILRKILPDQEHTSIKYYGHPISRLFLDLSLNSQAVVCCRVAPKQKALVVRMVKSNIVGAITLSIGDGANDVPMLKEADVGVGIFGEEGTQAAMASDYAIGEFKNMKRLVLIHGRVNYLRIVDLIQYFFLKNFILTIPQIYFAFYNLGSGKTYFDEWYAAFYNTFFTALPLLVKACFDFDFREEDHDFVRRNLPYTYYVGRENLLFTAKAFSWTTLKAIMYSCLIFFLGNQFLEGTPMGTHGEIADFYTVGIGQFTALIIIAKILVFGPEISSNWLSSLSVLISLFMYFLYQWYANHIFAETTYKVLEHLYTYSPFWMNFIFAVGFTFIFTKAEQVIQLKFIPNIWNLVLRGSYVSF